MSWKEWCTAISAVVTIANSNPTPTLHEQGQRAQELVQEARIRENQIGEQQTTGQKK